MVTSKRRARGDACRLQSTGPTLSRRAPSTSPTSIGACADSAVRVGVRATALHAGVEQQPPSGGPEQNRALIIGTVEQRSEFTARTRVPYTIACAHGYAAVGRRSGCSCRCRDGSCALVDSHDQVRPPTGTAAHQDESAEQHPRTDIASAGVKRVHTLQWSQQALASESEHGAARAGYLIDFSRRSNTQHAAHAPTEALRKTRCSGGGVCTLDRRPWRLQTTIRPHSQLRPRHGQDFLYPVAPHATVPQCMCSQGAMRAPPRAVTCQHGFVALSLRACRQLEGRVNAYVRIVHMCCTSRADSKQSDCRVQRSWRGHRCDLKRGPV